MEAPKIEVAEVAPKKPKSTKKEMGQAQILPEDSEQIVIEEQPKHFSETEEFRFFEQKITDFVANIQQASFGSLYVAAFGRLIQKDLPPTEAAQKARLYAEAAIAELAN